MPPGASLPSISCKIGNYLEFIRMICPKCRENKAHRSRRSGLRDRLAGLFLRTPHRCGSCKLRFYVNLRAEGALKLRTPEEKRVIKLRRELQARKIRRQLLGYGLSSLILVLVLYYLFQQRIYTE